VRPTLGPCPDGHAERARHARDPGQEPVAQGIGHGRPFAAVPVLNEREARVAGAADRLTPVRRHARHALKQTLSFLRARRDGPCRSVARLGVHRRFHAGVLVRLAHGRAPTRRRARHRHKRGRAVRAPGLEPPCARRIRRHRGDEERTDRDYRDAPPAQHPNRTNPRHGTPPPRESRSAITARLLRHDYIRRRLHRCTPMYRLLRSAMVG
jgi:hypothetical protein